MSYTRLDRTFDKTAANRLDDATQPGLNGALAALESFYFAFNNGDLNVLCQVWVPDELIRLNNPLGGILNGIGPISALYDGIFNGAADVWVEFWDIAAYDLGDNAAVFSGRERGQFIKAGRSVDLDIRTSRVFHRVDGRWGQVHHHGSITDTELLDNYRNAVQS
ncbi:MAG: nuclear transport factor 2 family protein [Acidimicrobiia bacterium]